MKKEKTMPMPTYTDVSSVGLVLAHIGRLSLLMENAEQYGHDATITSEYDEEKHEIDIIFLSRSGKTVVKVPAWGKGVSSSKCRSDQLFTFLLCKIAEEALDKDFTCKLSFPLNELVECGIFKTIRSARQAFNETMSFMEKIQLSSSRKIIKSNIGDKNAILFYHSEIKNGVCYICLNDNFDWELISKPFINMSKAAFQLTPQAFRIAKAVYRYTRTDCKTETYKMPLGYVIAKSGIIVDPQNAKRTLDNLKKYVHEINCCPNIGFHLSLGISKGKNIKDALYHSALIVDLGQRIINDMKRVNDLQTAEAIMSAQKVS